MSNQRVTLGRLWALMLTVLVDMLGFLIVAPLLPFYATRLGASPLLVGLMASTFAVAQLATSPFWGKLSDRRGRRPMLMIGISISAGAHLMFALACSNWAMQRFDSRGLIALLFLSRFIQGAGGATTGVVQAYVADAIVPEERAKALGWISAATSAGVMAGPAIGSLGSLLGPMAPGLIATALCVVNLFFAQRYLEESSTAEERARAAKGDGRSLRHRTFEVAMHPRRPVARLIWIYAVPMMAFMAMNGVLALYLQARFAFTEKTIGFVYVFVGSISLVMRSMVLGPAVRLLGERGMMRAGLVSLAIGFAAQSAAHHLAVFALSILFIPIGTALLFPATTSLVSRYAERHELGVTMGVQQAFGGVARLLGPAWAGAAFQAWGPGAPFQISAVLAVLTLVYALGLEPPPKVDVARTMVAKAGASDAAAGG